ncbi:MAG: phosphatidylglycerophosphatase A [Brevinematales bacterium]|nr:phosphatidylglycerophosphatase A [Brevinematales bacterium]
MKFLVKIISTGFFVGYIPFFPGTFGSILGVLIYFFFLSKLDSLVFLLITFFAFISAILICDFAEKKIFKIKDHNPIVLDEIIGIFITFIPVSSPSIFNILTGFILFRIFDIIKPFPIKNLQTLNGGLGIVIDDFMAGIYAASTLYILSVFKPF